MNQVPIAGTSIPVRCQIDNQSSRYMTLKGSLRQKIKVTVDAHQKTETNKLYSVKGTQIDGKTNTQQMLSVSIPTNLPIVHKNCQVIDISYFVCVKLDIPGSFDLRLEMPILLTNAPIS